ncbi:hypothetical protein [Novosphingobium gossypii]|uniref:hypothetical protein n=1 Tax=Novosphingobium gossypii TaxID=1604774 RepID=UPI003D1C648D
MQEIIGSRIVDVVRRAPEWGRRELETKDAPARERAEETTALMIAEALRHVDLTARAIG